VKAWIIGLGAVAGAIAAVIGLVLIFQPDLKPCAGTTTAAFADVASTRVAPLQADVSYTVETHGYRGDDLRVVWSLLRRDAGGSFTPVPGFDALEAAVLTPESCNADAGGSDIPVPVVEGGSYRVVLELFPPDDGLRIARASTDFRLGRPS
jgi:hypothetical protein